MSEHPELKSEQAYLDHAYRRVDEIRQSARERMAEVLDLGKGGTFQSRTERDVVVRSSLARIDQLAIGDQPLCFGRIDREDTERYYIGRMGVSSAEHDPLVIDWRARVAEPFYRATGRHPMGLVRRRHFAVQGRTITAIEDEPLKLGDSAEEARGLVVRGQGALLAALERNRSGVMVDIVATIQGEQDEVIRSPLAGTLVVQGGPGTGKTAVALHRAAYLLYTHRFPLEHLGVLVVGPNPVFLRYIGHVLPSLGESGVTLSTISGLVPDVVVRAEESQVRARIKGDIRMTKVIRRAIKQRQRPLKADLAIGFGSQHLRVRAEETTEIINTVRRRGGSHNMRRKSVERLLIELLFVRFTEASERESIRAITARPLELDGFSEAVSALPEFVEACDRMWPKLYGVELVHDLFGAKPLLRLAARGILSDDEIDALYRERSTTVDDIRWTDADVPLVDEARVLLGPPRPLAEHEVFQQSYGHVVSDETQDLSPMQLRMLGRRSVNGSMTLVGDLAQTTGAWQPKSWAEVCKHIGLRSAVREVELTIGYRTPTEVMAVASDVLHKMNLGLTPPNPVRSSGTKPEIQCVDDAQALTDALVERVRQHDAGTMGIVSVDAESICVALRNRGCDVGLARRIGKPDRESTVLCATPDLAKGLEFDHVIVVDPNDIVQSYSLAALYVALTRTIHQLSVITRENVTTWRVGLLLCKNE